MKKNNKRNTRILRGDPKIGIKVHELCHTRNQDDLLYDDHIYIHI